MASQWLCTSGSQLTNREQNDAARTESFKAVSAKCVPPQTLAFLDSLPSAAPALLAGGGADRAPNAFEERIQNTKEARNKRTAKEEPKAAALRRERKVYGGGVGVGEGRFAMAHNLAGRLQAVDVVNPTTGRAYAWWEIMAELGDFDPNPEFEADGTRVRQKGDRRFSRAASALRDGLIAERHPETRCAEEHSAERLDRVLQSLGKRALEKRATPSANKVNAAPDDDDDEEGPPTKKVAWKRAALVAKFNRDLKKNNDLQHHGKETE